MCADHCPPVADAPIGTQVAAQAPPVIGTTSLAKRTRDRAYRLATSIVRSRHEAEFREVYAQVLAGEWQHDDEVAA